MSYRILTDADLARLVSMPDAVAAMEQALRLKAAGALVAPPRFQVRAGEGALVFTAGATTGGPDPVIGFRVYDTFPGHSADRQQLVAVFDASSGAFKGLVIGELLGALRTGALGGVAIRHMARPEASRVALLGSGLQARTQLAAAAAVRQLSSVQVYSPNQSHREAFAAEMSQALGLPVVAYPSARQAVEQAEIVICATRSTSPVFDPAWLQPGAHINTVGPKFVEAHELDPRAAQQCQVIASDSLAQVDAYARPFFLNGTAERERMVELSDIVAGRQPGRFRKLDNTLFCSVGLAGTEVVLASLALGR